MNVLVITGDKNFKPGHPRYELQRSAVEKLEVVYWGGSNIFPRIPREKFDVVSVQDPFWRGVYGWYIARKVGARLNVQVHTDLSAHSFARHILSQIVLRHADSIRVVSEKIKQQVERLGVRGEIHVLPVFVDVERFRKAVRAPEENLILWIGRFEDEKDPLAAVEICKKIIGAKLIMLGKGSLENAVRAAAEGFAVEFPGWVDPLPYLARAAVVLSTSRHESFGASIVEALAAGVPVVSPDVGVAKEAGAIVAKREELAEKLLEVLNTHPRGWLNLDLPPASQWAVTWRKTLE